MNSPANSSLRIGDFRVDPALDEIYKDGAPIKLEPRTMRLLVCLAERAGQVVSVEQLLDLVWKDVVVSSDSVYAAIAGLRRTLGDDPKQPAYIANVMRRGYRLVAPVSPWIESSTAPLADAPPAVTGRRRAALIGTMAMLCLIAAVTLYIRHVREQRPKAQTISDKSVAVLPFLDLSEKKDEQYFADGMSEELIDLLVKVPDLRIPARTSSFYFKDKTVTVAEIATTLGVAHVLEGSVRKSGDTLRITAQLVRADNGYHVWSQTFDRPMADIFKIQDEIAAEVVRALKASLLPTDGAKPVLTSSPAAYNFYLKARTSLNDGAIVDGDVAFAYLKQALVLDPQFAAAWALLAKTLVFQLDWGDSSPYVERCARGHEAANESLRLDPSYAEGYSALSRVLYVCDWNWTAADAAYVHALLLDPTDAETVRSYSGFAWSAQWVPTALRMAHRAVELDPLNTWSFFELAMAQGSAGDFDAAIASWHRAIELGASVRGMHGLLANALLAVGRPEEALQEAFLEGGDGGSQTLPFIYEALGRHADADKAIESYVAQYARGDAQTPGAFYACRKDVEKSIHWLGLAVKQHEMFTDVPNRYGCFRNVEHDPRYRAMLRDMHLPAVPSS